MQNWERTLPPYVTCHLIYLQMAGSVGMFEGEFVVMHKLISFPDLVVHAYHPNKTEVSLSYMRHPTNH